MSFTERISNIVSKYMAALVILMAIAAFFKPEHFTWIAPNITLLKVVALPIAAGFIVNMLFGGFVQKAEKLLPIISIIAIVMILAAVVAVSAERIKETGLLIMAVVICHNISGYCLGFVLAKLCRMDLAKVKAISIEVGMQNSGLATSLTMLHFGAAAAIPGAIFSVWHNISGSLAANYLASRK